MGPKHNDPAPAHRRKEKMMREIEISRREMISGSAAAIAVAAMGVSRTARAAGSLTVQDVLNRMKEHIGGPWFPGGVDRIIEGSPDTEVRGIGTTMMATMDALKDAVKIGANLIITHESTYWSHQDTLTDLKNNPLYKTKRDYMRDHNLVSFHFHDHWHALRPVDGINRGMQLQMGWSEYMDPQNQRIYNLPPTTLLGLAQEFKTKLNDRTLRVVGDPNLPVRRVYESWGYCDAFPGITFLDSDVDALVIGEAQDWNLIAYTHDLVSSGQKKGLIVLGHMRSEMWGMKYCAEWLSGFVPEVPVHFIPIIEPYWNIQSPVFEINTKI
jgi:putative NIF3 family GTP cyclohydrolase 1 type 2